MDSKHVPIFVINLNGHTDRLERISRRLNALGLSFERIPAINGQTLSREEKQKICLERSCLPLSDCEIAHYMSHLKALRIVVDRELPRAIILEDDAVFDDDFALWASSECPLPAEVEILKFEGSGARDTIKIPISTYANRTIQFSYKPAGGAAAYLITFEAARKALKELDVASAQLAHDLFAYWKFGVRVYEVAPFPAHQEGSPSTIAHSARKQPLRTEFGRYMPKSFDKARRLYFSVKWFGVGALLTATRV
jgi:glycosyl transferase family 25